MARKGDWFYTATGHKFWPQDPRPSDFHIEDIAHGLANKIRFGGHIRDRYTVAQHSVHVLQLVSNALQYDPFKSTKVEFKRVDRRRQAQRLALLHDAAEAYLGDMPTPIKKALPDYRAMEDDVLKAIFKRFQVVRTPFIYAAVKKADTSMLMAEARRFHGKDKVAKWRFPHPSNDSLTIMHSTSIWDFDMAKEEFLGHFKLIFH